MQSHLRQIKDMLETSPYSFVKFSSIGKSNGGVDIPLLKISNHDKKKNQKPTIVIIGR